MPSFNSRTKTSNPRSPQPRPVDSSSNTVGEGGNEVVFEPKLDAPQQAGSPHDSQPKPRPPYHPQAQLPLDSPYGAVSTTQGSSPNIAAPPAHNDFVDQVARSQSLSQRYPTSLQTHYSSAASTSTDDLGQTTVPSPSPIPSPPGYAQHPQQQHPPEKRSARKLIKNIFAGSSSKNNNPPEHQAAHYDNTGGFARRPSKRVSNPPSINIRSSYAQLSQTSLDQEAGSDWPPPLNPQSPLPGVGEVDERYLRRDSNLDLLLQNQNVNAPPGALNPTIRPVQPAEDLAFHRDQQRHFVQASGDFDRPPPLPQHLQQFSQPTSHPPPQQGQGHYQPGPPSTPGVPLLLLHTTPLNPNPHNQNPETISQISRESPITDSDPPSTQLQSTTTSPSGTFGNTIQENPLPPLPPEAQQQDGQQQHGSMPPGGSIRRSQDTESKGRGQEGQPLVGAPPPYPRGPVTNTMPPPPPGPGNQPTPALRAGGSGPDRLPYDGSQNTGDQGRASPQPSTGDDPDKQFRELLTKYKNVKRLYFDGKAQIEQMSAQVEQLQNAIANQRMSQSRTALDDNEYTTRFNRLNGAINNLSFNIRKDWRTVPRWLEMYVSPDALKTGKQEMTALGRAVITRWIFEEVFNKCFHPALEPGLSQQLKQIEMNIRRYSYTMHSQEEHDALTTKVVNWRMATLEGLAREVNGPEAAEHRADFTRKATTNLTATLFQFLNEPPPAGVDGSTSMIVELAVGLAANLPMESRDVSIIYPLPGDSVQLHLMEVEKQGLPLLESQKGESDEAADDSGDTKERSSKAADPRRGLERRGTAPTGPPKDPNKVRLAGFVAVEVRGRQVLMKAPVWTLG